MAGAATGRNLPAGALALAVLARTGASTRRVVPFDWTGQICAVLALAALTYGVIEGGEQGYGSTPILAAFAVAVAASAAFLATQAQGRHPMVPLELFRSRAVAILLAAVFIGMVGFYGTVFLQSLYFQQLRGEVTVGHRSALPAHDRPGRGAEPGRGPRRHALRPPGANRRRPAGHGHGPSRIVPGPSPRTLLIADLMIPVGVGGSFTVPPITALLLTASPPTGLAPPAGS